MDEKLLLSKLKFEPLYLDGNPRILNRKVRIGVVNILRKENADVVIMGEYSINTFLAYITKILFRLKCKIYTICDDSKDIAESVKGCRKIGHDDSFSKYSLGIICQLDEIQKAIEIGLS